MIGTGVSRCTTAPNLCHIRVTLEPSVDHTPDRALAFVSLDLGQSRGAVGVMVMPDRALSFVSLDLGQSRGAASLVSMLSHIHVRSISLDVTPPPLTRTLSD